MKDREVPLVHPGEILLEDWLIPLNISQYALAKAINVPPRRINEIVQGKRSITADTALRLAAFFGTDAQSWLNLQTHYDAQITEEKIAVALAEIKPFNQASTQTQHLVQ
ncbi:HigA family addiction module antitoxin [Gallibacterium anatis]|uniref:HigA family addiction module antitoxin n=1 Tax=Gallibacterium anatis TaxID=750 RepID=UPI003005E468